MFVDDGDDMLFVGYGESERVGWCWMVLEMMGSTIDCYIF